MKSLVWPAFLSFLLTLGPLPVAWAKDGGPTGSKITGKVVAADGKTPASGARVLAYHLATERVYTSGAVRSNAEYALDQLPFGYFELAVETPEGLYVGSEVVHLPPAGRLAVTLTVKAFGSADEPGAGETTYPGSDQEMVGLAQLRPRPRGREFWRSPRGIAILGGSAAVALLVIARGSGSKDDPVANPVAP